MKRVNFLNWISQLKLVEGVSFVWLEWRRQQFPLAIFLLLCLNLVLAPVVYAASNSTLERRSAWAIGILGLVILGLVIYLFDVVFRPERY